MVESGIARAFLRFIKNDHHLLTVDASERSMTHRLAVYLEQEFPEYHVDCEYNRKLCDTKTIDLWRDKIKTLETKRDNYDPYSKDYEEIQGIIDGGEVSVYPDIIIHHRGTDNNFIVIEAKKLVGNPVIDDQEKLKSFKSSLTYKHAYQILFPVGNQLETSEANNWKDCVITL